MGITLSYNEGVNCCHIAKNTFLIYLFIKLFILITFLYLQLSLAKSSLGDLKLMVLLELALDVYF